VCVCVCVSRPPQQAYSNKWDLLQVQKAGRGAGGRRNVRADLHLSLQLLSTTLTASRNDPWCRLVWKPSGLVLKQDLQVDQRVSLVYSHPLPAFPMAVLKYYPASEQANLQASRAD
jgi:hypothetical protein